MNICKNLLLSLSSCHASFYVFMAKIELIPIFSSNILYQICIKTSVFMSPEAATSLNLTVKKVVFVVLLV